MCTPLRVLLLTLAGAAVTAASLDGQEGFRFRSGVELINVTATVTDRNGRFVQGLKKDDFTVYEDGSPQEIAHFSNEPAPVSLGILLDTSGSMTAGRMAAARAAIDRFVFELLGPDDELFFMTFASRMELVQPWTTDRGAISQAAARARAGGSTAMYDAVAAALPLAEAGSNRKKALLVITDGHDNSSRTTLAELRRQVHESEVLIYALGVEESSGRRGRSIFGWPFRQIQLPIPIPGPGGRRPPGMPRPGPIPVPMPAPGGTTVAIDDDVNEEALREMTDGSGGRTEIVRGFDGLDAATARLADELSAQYYLGYVRAGERDGRWRAIRVEVRDRRLTVRARQGYFAT